MKVVAMAAKCCRANVGHCRAYNGLRSMSARVTLRVGNYLNLEHSFFFYFYRAASCYCSFAFYCSVVNQFYCIGDTPNKYR